jgi:lipopolysaccharide cholinephosphotransferase
MVDLKISLPDEFLNEEVRCGYTVTRQMKEVWAVELDLLNELLCVCKKNGIKIYAIAGTLLGTIRHKGFIPWDDDIDMAMFREDYKKLCKIAKKEFKKPYFFQTEYSDPGSMRGHAQLRNSDTTGILKSEYDRKYRFNQGIFIDIFVWDNVIEDKGKFDAQLEEITKYKKRFCECSMVSTRYQHKCKQTKDVVKAVIYYCGGFEVFKIIEMLLYRKCENISQMYNDIDTPSVSAIAYTTHEKHRLREDFNSIIYMPFENLLIPVCDGYDRVLKTTYGNYMNIAKPRNVHGGVIFDTNISYEVYMKKNVCN